MAARYNNSLNLFLNRKHLPQYLFYKNRQQLFDLNFKFNKLKQKSYKKLRKMWVFFLNRITFDYNNK